MGYISENVAQMLRGCDLVMLESNYEPGMLSACDYPYYLKRRIASNTGHLSNEVCAQELIELVRTGSTRFVLGHLSQKQQHPRKRLPGVLLRADGGGWREGIDFTLTVASRSGPSEMVVL